MASKDHTIFAGTIAPTNGQSGVPRFVQTFNNRRTERYNLTVTAQVDITVAGTAVRNRGSILAALQQVMYVDGGVNKVQGDGRILRQFAEVMAPSPLPATRLAGFGVQAATQLRETLPLWLSAPRTFNPNETKYVEVNKQLMQQIGVNPSFLIGALAQGATGTITNLQVKVEQICDNMLSDLTWLSPYYREVVQDVPGSNASLKIDLRGNRAIRAIIIQQDTDQGEVSDIISTLVLRGDRESIVGDAAVPFQDLVDHQADEYGGTIAPGYYVYDFLRYGRLTSLWNPNQDTNLRLELGVTPSASPAGGTGSKIRVGIFEYERTAATIDPLPLNF